MIDGITAGFYHEGHALIRRFEGCYAKPAAFLPFQNISRIHEPGESVQMIRHLVLPDVIGKDKTDAGVSGCQIKDLRTEVVFVAVAHKHKQVFGGIQWRKCAFYKIKEQQRLLRLQKITAVVDIRDRHNGSPSLSFHS